MLRIMPRSRALPLAGLLLIGLLTLVLVGRVDQAQADHAIQEGEAQEATPTPSPPDPDLAAEFAGLGELEAAIGAYRAVVEEGAAEERVAARLALGRLYIDSGQIPAAVYQLDAYLFEAPASADVRAAQFLLAEALVARGDWSGALPLYEAYIQAGGGASTYAGLSRAEGLARTGRTAEAVQAGELLLAEELPASVRRGFLLSMAQALEGRDDGEALVWYGRLLEESDSPGDQALALFRTAMIQGDMGDSQGWTTNLLAIVERYPGTSTALQVLDDFGALKLLLDDYLVARVYYHNGRGATARETFEDLVAAEPPTPNSARAAFYLAVLDEEAGDIDEAIDGYGRVLGIDASIELADDALWWRGRLLEKEGRFGAAKADYERLASEFGGSKWAADARIRPGLLDYDAGRYDEAEGVYAAVAEETDGEERQRALLWQGKALAGAGDREGAEAVWETLRKEAAADYYGLRAAVLLGDAVGSMRDAGLGGQRRPDWDAIQGWAVEATGVDPLVALARVLFDEHWSRGQALLGLGLRREAGAEFTLVLNEAEGNAGVLLQVARFMQPAGMAEISSRAAAQLLNAVPEEDATMAPADLWRLAYPAPYAGALREAVDAEDVPDLLLLAMVRQESFFNPLAGSPAGALGLTQVIAPTAEQIAGDLGIADFEFEDLQRPSVSMRFGASYLRGQLDAFDGNIYSAMAAYNGGPGSVARWLEDSGDDIDRFVEEIEFAETRLYVRLVSENLARYRQLYQGLAEPSLPEE